MKEEEETNNMPGPCKNFLCKSFGEMPEFDFLAG